LDGLREKEGGRVVGGHHLDLQNYRTTRAYTKVKPNWTPPN